MRVALTLLALLLFAGAWWLLSADSTPFADEPYDEQSSAEGGAGKLLTGRDGTPSSDGFRRAQPSGIPALDMRKAPRGPLTVIPVDAEDNPVSIDDVIVHLYPAGRKWPSSPMAFRNRDTNGWDFKNVYAGPVRIVVTGNKIHDATQSAVVAVRAQDPVRVRVRQAGGLRYMVRPKGHKGLAKGAFTIEIFKDERPVTAWFQEMHRRGMTSRMQTSKATLGPAGYITGLRAGMYVLRATTDKGFYANADIDVREGEVLQVPLEVSGVEPFDPKPEPKAEPPKGPERDPELDKHGIPPK